MKILVLNGSPKGNASNTLKVTKAFCNGIIKKIPSELEILDVYKINIHECKGCFACWNITPGKCKISDDMSLVLEKILNSDIIVWSFPLYYFNIPSRLKIVIDRQLPLSLPFMKSDAEKGGHESRYNMKNKRFVLISTCGFYTADTNYSSIEAQFNRIYGKNGYTSIFCGQGELFRIPELSKRTNQYLNIVEKAGNEFALGPISQQTSEELKQILYPREVFERMADASWGIVENESTQNMSKAYIFTKQMAAIYNSSSWSGKDIVLEFFYTDIQENYQIILGKSCATVFDKDFLSYTTKIETPFAVWKQIASGKIDGNQALMNHLYRVKGDLNLLIHWNNYFGKEKLDVEKNNSKRTNMLLLLIPWMMMRFLLSVDPFYGATLGIVLCSILPFFYLIYTMTIFDYISISSVLIMCLLSIVGIDSHLLVSTSYLIFGLMWLMTIFLKVPITAYYSMNNYGYKTALKNLLFLRTNRVLSACWGVLYILIAIQSYFSLPLWMNNFDIFSVIFMGIFTIWFIKWYPKYYASK